MERIKSSERQGITADLDESTILLMPHDNRHKFSIRWHPDNAGGEGVWIHKVPGTVKFNRDAAVDDASAGATKVAGAADATDENSGIFISPETPGFTEDGERVFSGALTAIGTAAGLKLVIDAY